MLSCRFRSQKNGQERSTESNAAPNFLNKRLKLTRVLRGIVVCRCGVTSVDYLIGGDGSDTTDFRANDFWGYGDGPLWIGNTVERSGIEALLRQDVELEIGSTFNEWFDSRAEELRAGEFVAKVRDELKTAVPDEDPGSDRTFPYIRGIAEAGNATPRPMLVSIPGARELPYRNVAELYVVTQLRRMARQEVNRRATSARVEGRKARSPLEILYSTPEAHRAIVDEALRRFSEKSISVRHDFPEATRTFSLMHTALPTNLDTAVRLAF